MTVLSAHQPNFMPWKAYFDKMRLSDVFVILDNVQFVRDDYHHRFNIGSEYYTLPVKERKHKKAIKDVKYNDVAKGWNDLKQRLPEYAEEFKLFDEFVDDRLPVFNENIIFRAYTLMYPNNRPKIRFDFESEKTKTDRIIELCEHYNADTYLAGEHSIRSYLNLTKMANAGIRVISFKPTDTRPLLKVLKDARLERSIRKTE